MNCPRCAGFALATAFVCPSCSYTLRPGAVLVGARMGSPRLDGLQPGAAPARALAGTTRLAPPLALPRAKSEADDRRQVLPAAGRRWGVRAATLALLTTGGLLAGLTTAPGEQLLAFGRLQVAVEQLPLTEVSARELTAGSGRLSLPDGSESRRDERAGQLIYHFEHLLPLAAQAEARVCFDITGNPDGIDAVLTRARLKSPDAIITPEVHRGKHFRALRLTQAADVDHANQRACYFECLDAAGNATQLVVYYAVTATDPRAMAAVLDRVLGSVHD